MLLKSVYCISTASFLVGFGLHAEFYVANQWRLKVYLKARHHSQLNNPCALLAEILTVTLAQGYRIDIDFFHANHPYRHIIKGFTLVSGIFKYRKMFKKTLHCPNKSIHSYFVNHFLAKWDILLQLSCMSWSLKTNVWGLLRCQTLNTKPLSVWSQCVSDGNTKMAFDEVPGEGNVLARVGAPYMWQAIVVLLEAVITIWVDHYRSECTLLWQTVNR